jgi:hypothetical protein
MTNNIEINQIRKRNWNYQDETNQSYYIVTALEGVDCQYRSLKTGAVYRTKTQQLVNNTDPIEEEDGTE